TGQTIATGGFDGRVLFWNWNQGNPIQRSPMDAHPPYRIDSLAFSPDGSYLASGAEDGLRLWRVGFDLVPQLHAEVLITGTTNIVFPQLSFNGLGTMLVAANWAGNKLYLITVSGGTV